MTSYLKKVSDFVSSPLFGLTLVTTLRKYDSESHQNILIFFDKKTGCQSGISCLTVSQWLQASLFELNFGNKLGNTNFKLY